MPRNKNARPKCASCMNHIFTGRQKGGFVKGWFWRMYPRSGFRSRGTCECTLVPVCVPGEHPNVPSFRFSFRGNIRQNHPFGKPPFWSSKTKTPQTVTLQVKIERGQKLKENSAHGSRRCSCLPPAPKFSSTKKKQLNIHLQCYHLQCFSFAQFGNP